MQAWVTLLWPWYTVGLFILHIKYVSSYALDFKKLSLGNSTEVQWLRLGWCFHCRGLGFDLWSRYEDPARCLVQPKQKKTKVLWKLSLLGRTIIVTDNSCKKRNLNNRQNYNKEEYSWETESQNLPKWVRERDLHRSGGISGISADAWRIY